MLSAHAYNPSLILIKFIEQIILKMVTDKPIKKIMYASERSERARKFS